MSKQKIGILVMFLLASAVSMAWGLLFTSRAQGIVLDYRLADIGARCLIHHCDLYNEPQMKHFYLSHGGEHSTLPSSSPDGPHYLAGFQVYPPSAEPFFAIFAVFPWQISYVAWISLSLLLIAIAAFLVWDVAHLYAPDLPFYLAGFLLMNSGGLLAGGNPAGIAVSLGVISVWCILQNRSLALGVICMAISLAIKPHDTGLIWLYLLLLGAPFRKRAVQVLLLTLLPLIGGIFWVSQVSPHWMQKMQSNLSVLASNGSCNDPGGPAAISMVNLQTALAFFKNDPRFYNLVAFAICTPLLVVFLFVAMRLKHSQKGVWLGLAAITVLSLLPLYHRPHDAKILLLTLPACALLWVEGGPIAWLALLLTTGGIVATSELPLIVLQVLPTSTASGIRGEVLSFLTTRPAPLILLAESVFYLCVYFRHYRARRRTMLDENSSQLLQSVR